MSVDETLANVEALFARTEDLRAKLEQTDDPDADLGIEHVRQARDHQRGTNRRCGRRRSVATTCEPVRRFAHP